MDVEIIAVPYDTAHRGWRCGAGPEYLLRSGLVAHLESRGHSAAEVRVIDTDPDEPSAEIASGFELMRRVAVVVRASRESGRFPLVLSGNCIASVGALSGLTPSRRAIFWFDAHGDMNTPDTTASGFLDGTGLATALGLCWHRLASSIPGFRPLEREATFLLGVRDLDPPEVALLADGSITAVAAERISDKLPLALARAPLEGAVGLVHLDLDVVDPDRVGRANRLPVENGLSVEQLTGAIAAIRRRLPLGAAVVASYDPEFDTDLGVCRAAFAALEALLSS